VALTGHLIELASDVNAVGAYLSTRDEPGTRDFLAWAHQQGITTLVPVSREDGLLDWTQYDGGAESEDVQGMPVAVTERLGPGAIDSVDLMVVPAACVDRTGMRLGWGRGYFDRALGSMRRRPPVYAVIFDSELLETVPSEAHDQRVDGVVTPSGITRFSPVS